MTEAQIRQLCERVSSQMDEIDESSDLPTFLESVEDIELTMIGAAAAKGFLSGALKISEKTLPLIVAAEAALISFTESLEEGDDEDEEDEDE